jgi:hypothetical protein
MAADPLTTWKDSPSKEAIVDFVRRVCGQQGSPAVPLQERVAVFDNDGTLWCEKPMPIQLDFILRRLDYIAGAEQALQRAEDDGWTVVGINNDWSTVFSSSAPTIACLVHPHAGDARSPNRRLPWTQATPPPGVPPP